MLRRSRGVSFANEIGPWETSVESCIRESVTRENVVPRMESSRLCREQRSNDHWYVITSTSVISIQSDLSLLDLYLLLLYYA